MENHKGTVTERRDGEAKMQRPGVFHRVALSPCPHVIFKARGNLTT
jgi:hypothetical protein